MGETKLKRFIGYHLSTVCPTDPKTETCPLATSRDANVCLSTAGVRALVSGLTDGHISVQDRTDDVTEEEYLMLEAVLNERFHLKTE